MCSGLIEWSAFDWPSFATLMTGGFAVLAAYLVGRRQTDIQSRQADIQEAMLRSDLFDRRYNVFERAERFIREILQKADDPSPETQREFLIAMGEARFLFSPKVREGLDEIWRKQTQHHLHRVTAEHEKEHVVFQWLAARFTNLPELFDEMKLDGTKL
jgi:hypothetical protein